MGLFDMIRSGANAVVNRAMPVPSAYDGLISPEDIAAARRRGVLGFGASLLGDNGPTGEALGRAINAGTGTYDQGVNSALQQGQVATQLGEQKRIRDARQQIAQQFPQAPNETQEMTRTRLQRIFAALVQAGDTELASKVGEVVKALGEGASDSVDHVDLGDRTQIIDKKTGRVIREEKKGIVPKTAAEVGADVKFKAGEKNKIIDDYARDTKDVHQVMAGWDVLQGALKDPSLATPFAMLDAYARITNPGAIVRPTTLEMLENMGSLGQRIKKFMAHNATGQLPQPIVKDLSRTMYNIVHEHMKQYQQIRSKAMTRAQQGGITDLDALLEDYKLVDPFAPAPTLHGAPRARQIMGQAPR